MLYRITVFFVLALFVSQQSHAYVGPGLGAGAIGVVLGVLGSIFVAIFAVVYYPIKRKLKRRKVEDVEDGAMDSQEEEEAIH